jgi:competence protein ComEC
VVVASHPHADHIVGLPQVLARFHVGVAMDPGCPDASPLYGDLRAAYRDDGVRVIHPRAGDSFSVGDLRLDVLSPSACFVGTSSDANNDAIVFRLSWREDTVLFATEPEEPAQQSMLDSGVSLHAEVLKVPHHGAATSLPEFFQAVDATVAVVSVGENNYGHPVPATLDAIARTGAEIWRTDQHGTITVSFEDHTPVVASDR